MINVRMLENNVDDSFREKLEQFMETYLFNVLVKAAKVWKNAVTISIHKVGGGEYQD